MLYVMSELFILHVSIYVSPPITVYGYDSLFIDNILILFLSYIYETLMV